MLMAQLLTKVYVAFSIISPLMIQMCTDQIKYIFFMKLLKYKK